MLTDPSAQQSTADFVLQLLREQTDLSAVERFSDWHETVADVEQTHATPNQSRYYQALLPLSEPGEGEQYGFRVDLDACSGCKACVVACHTLNGLEEDESWRRVGAFTVNEPLPQLHYVTAACHHCADPACLHGCPVVAYDKDPLTGIVRHLDDQCIGCKYCIMMCPYEVPQYSSRLGIVRKCDMCHQRLSVGEAPACVQACPNEAIAIQITSRTRAYTQQDALVPNGPNSIWTRPTTSYVGHSVLNQSAIPLDHEIDHPHESHWPLAIMLVFTQAAVGILLIEPLMSTSRWLFGIPSSLPTMLISSATALSLALIGLGIAPLHLGQPLRAWRVFLGLRTSWLSREAVLLGKFAGMLLLAVALMVARYSWPESTVVQQIPDALDRILLSMALVLGLAGVLSSAMIYIVTHRELWNRSRTFGRFFGSMLVLGLVFMSTFHGTPTLATCAAIALLTKLNWEWSLYLAHQRAADSVFQARSRRLIHRELSHWAVGRLALGSTGAVLCLVALAMLLVSWNDAGGAVMLLACVLITGGEICERLLYFSSVVFHRMPGMLK